MLELFLLAIALVLVYLSTMDDGQTEVTDDHYEFQIEDMPIEELLESGLDADDKMIEVPFEPPANTPVIEAGDLSKAVV